LLIAAAGEKLTAKERLEFKRLTGRDYEPGCMVREFVAIAGRRSGKSYAMACFLVWIATMCDHRDALVPGEMGVALCISRDQRVAKIILEYCRGIIADSPQLAMQLINVTADAIELKGRIFIEVRPCNRATLRGMTCIAIIADELGHWFTSVDFANPDVEVPASVRPALLTTHGPLLLASSVYAKTGVLYDTWARDYGAKCDPSTLVAFGTSRDFNSSLSQADVDREVRNDPVRNPAEYLSEWRDDIAGFISRDIVEACIGDYLELSPQPNCVYVIFVGPATGAENGDSYALAVAHRQGDMIVIDAPREVRAPFSPSQVIADVAIPLAKTYNCYTIVGDNYAGAFAQEPFRNAGLSYELATKHKTQLYLDPFLSLLNSKHITVPKNDRAIAQICSLERSAKRSGRDEISHPSHGNDNLANVIAGAAFLAYDAFGLGGYNAFGGLEPDEQQMDSRSYRTQQLAGLLELAVHTGGGSGDCRSNGSVFGGHRSAAPRIPYQSPYRRGW
jgi:hypothetical protein